MAPAVTCEIETGNPKLPRYGVAALIVILLLAASLRLFRLGESPPGLNQDEAVCAWNAYCLLKTGTDQHGVSWPVFYTRGLGENKSTLCIYALIPFQAIGGMSIYTTRLPGAMAGVLTVFLVYFTGKRLFGWRTGLIGAALLAVDPWNLQQSRWGHEATLGALAGLLPLAMLLWARIPITGDESQPARPYRAVLAGLLTGVVCYGYHSFRIFVPVFLFAAIIVTLPAWYRQLKRREGILSLAGWLTGFLVTFGPLAWQHIFHPQGIGRHAYYNTLWSGSESFTTICRMAMGRYLDHFMPGFLFIEGDKWPGQSPPGMGMLYWYMLPLMLAGLVVLIRRLRSSYPARLVLVFVLTYPIGDTFFGGVSSNALRCFPGSCGLVLLAATGAFGTFDWLSQHCRQLVKPVIWCFAAVVVISNLFYLPRFFIDYNQRTDIREYFNVPLLESLEWLKPRLADSDLVFCTTRGLNMPYVISLVALDYDPHRWFAGVRDYQAVGEWQICDRYGNMYFLYGSSFIDVIRSASPDTRIYFVVRPHQVPMEPQFRVRQPDGTEAFWVCTARRSDMTDFDSTETTVSRPVLPPTSH